jgi:hypothetical protein
MKNLALNIRETQVAPASLAIFWISQAGFVFKTPSARVRYGFQTDHGEDH